MESSKRKSVVFARYLWLYGEIVSKGPITFETINDDWTRSSLNDSGTPMPHKTFENHRKAIEDMFNISIECNRTNNTYYIEPYSQPDFSKATMDMLNGTLLFNRVQANPQLSKYIRLEENCEDSAMLFTVTDALAESRGLKLIYWHNFDPTRETIYQVKPIAIKQFRRRWYLIAELEKGTTYSFALDRIVDIEKGDKVISSQIDVDDLFIDAYGIIREAATPVEDITLKVEREQANYFISRPLHASQRIIEQNNNTVTFSLRLCPTYDFMMELLSHGAKIEVLAPQSLREQISARIKEMSNLYTK